MGYHNLDGFMTGEKMRANKDGMPTHCLIMDEVDGMAGNEDRGGVQVRNFISGLGFDRDQTV